VHVPSGGIVAVEDRQENAVAPMAEVKTATKGQGGKFCGRGGSRGGQQSAAPKAATGNSANATGTPAANILCLT
jgi:hypothetical protein